MKRSTCRAQGMSKRKWKKKQKEEPWTQIINFRHWTNCCRAQRKGTLRDVPDSQFAIQPTPTSDHQIFTLTEKTKPQKVLGVHTVLYPATAPPISGTSSYNRVGPWVDWSTPTQCYHRIRTQQQPSISIHQLVSPWSHSDWHKSKYMWFRAPRTLCALLGRLHTSSKMSRDLV